MNIYSNFINSNYLNHNIFFLIEKTTNHINFNESKVNSIFLRLD